MFIPCFQQQLAQPVDRAIRELFDRRLRLRQLIRYLFDAQFAPETKDDDAPLAGAVVVLTGDGGAPIDAWGEAAERLSSRFVANDKGLATISGVRAGRVHVEVRLGAATIHSLDVDVVAGRATSVDVR